MLQILYNIIITPLELLIEIIYTCSYRLLHNAGFAILAVSLVVNILLLPLYLRADALSAEESKRQKDLSVWLKHIRKAFAKDERFFILNSYYREMNYRPIMAIYSIFPLCLQIPFFIAAYHFFSGLSTLSGTPFLMISDLSMPDGLLVLSSQNAVHLLPIIMTAINCLSVYVYSKELPLKDKLRSYAIALVFLVLLYQSPSGLLLYWTANNLFSLIKNIVLSHKTQTKPVHSSQQADKGSGIITYLLLAELTLLLGGIIPADVVNSSVTEMVNVGVNTTPLHYVLYALQVYGGLFLFWGTVIQLMLPRRKRALYTGFLLALSACLLIGYYCFPYTGSSLTNALTFVGTPVMLDISYMIRNTLVMFVVPLLTVLLWKKYPRFIFSIATVLPVISIIFFLRDAINIHEKSSAWYKSHPDSEYQQNSANIPLSRNGKNIIVIGLDRAINNYLPFFFAEKPELYQSFDGFTWYPNTVSFGIQTPVAMPSLMGGYEYTPFEMNARADESLIAKTNEALRVMPAVFSESGFNVTVIDPPLANYQTPGDVSIYDDIPNVNAFLMDGYFASEEEKAIATHLLERNTVFFSLYRSTPAVFNNCIYDEGRYLNAEGFLPPSSFIEANSVLKSLSSVSDVSDSEENNFIILYNNTTHEPALLSSSDYDVCAPITGYNETPPTSLTLGDQTISFVGREDFDTSFSFAHYHINMAAFLRLADYFDYLKQEGVWDNTRIIIVADHGKSLNNFDYMLYKLDLDPQLLSTLNDSTKAELNNFTIDIESINPQLMVKDFNSEGFNVNYSFMTNADVPCLATDGVVTAPINPYTLSPLSMEQKYDEVDIPYMEIKHGSPFTNCFPIEESLILHVHDNIYDEQNWSYNSGASK